MPPRRQWAVRTLDLMSRPRRMWSYMPCLNESPDTRYLCSRPEGHGRRHAASDGVNIIQVWER
jgi:hypothetical protein